MKRLNNRAFEILKQEIDRYSKNDILAQAGRDIVGRRLERLLREEGQPLRAQELQEILKDFFPNFNKEVIKKAAKANQPTSIWSKLVWAPVALVGGVGVIWFLNLPYPMIRRPVARVAPMALFPSYMSMDYNYRQAVAKVEQADQLVNQATSAADINLGAEKVTEAQGHLDALPVWFLGYYPQRYCTFFSCSWKFTLDEFERARKQIGRMDAIAFQEKNALDLLNKAEKSIEIARQQYGVTSTPEEQKQAIADWQAAIDILDQIPSSTLAGKSARPKLTAAKRDLKEQADIAAGNQRSGSLIEAAKQFGMAAAVASQNPPHSAQQWEQISNFWQEAVNRLKQVPVDSPGYLEAQTKLAEYQINLGNAQIRWQNERDSEAAIKRAKNLIADWQRYALNDSQNTGVLASKLQDIINQLDLVKPGTTTHREAQELLQFAKNKLQELNK
jgi:hypothetical protein